MRFHEIKFPDVANGTGIRVSLFVSGCHHHCPGCFNPETWDFNSGKLFGTEQVEQLKKILSNPYVTGLSLLGGEPLEPVNAGTLAKVVSELKTFRPDIDVWCWTGYTFEHLTEAGNAAQLELLQQLDVLVDGQFMEKQKDLRLRFRGSANQRILDCRKSLDQGAAAEWAFPDKTKKEETT